MRGMCCNILVIFTIMNLLGDVSAEVRPDDRGRVDYVSGPPAEDATEPNGVNGKLSSAFRFTLRSVEVSAKMLNVADPNEIVQTLAITVRVDILDVAQLVSIDVEAPGVVEMLDQRGRVVECESTKHLSYRHYEDFGYWSALTVEERSRYLSIPLLLSSQVRQSDLSAISQLTGYIYALYAADIIEVDVPFDRSTGCVEDETVAGLSFCVDSKLPVCPGPYNSMVPPQLYKWRTYVRARAGEMVMCMREARPFYPRDEFPLGDYCVVRTELLDSIKGTTCHVIGAQFTQSGGGAQGAICWGEMEQAPSDTYDTIRHIIAVDPVEVKIPFVLRDVPVPDLQ